MVQTLPVIFCSIFSLDYYFNDIFHILFSLLFIISFHTIIVYLFQEFIIDIIKQFYRISPC